MILTYNGYAHPVGEPAVAIHRNYLRNEALDVIAIVERWDIAGMLISNLGAGDLDAKVAATIAAYSVDGGDLSLTLPTGAVSQHSLSSSNALGGIRVVSPVSFPDGKGAEGVTYRNFTVSLEAELPISNPTSGLLSFEESLSFTGGGPVFGHLEPVVGPPIKQLLKDESVYRVTQSGKAVGYLGWPNYPGPLWPSSEMRNHRQETRSGPRRKRNDYCEYTVAWNYQFEEASQLYGNPTVWT